MGKRSIRNEIGKVREGRRMKTKTRRVRGHPRSRRDQRKSIMTSFTSSCQALNRTTCNNASTTRCHINVNNIQLLKQLSSGRQSASLVTTNSLPLINMAPRYYGKRLPKHNGSGSPKTLCLPLKTKQYRIQRDRWVDDR